MTPVERVARAIYENRNGPGCKTWAHQPRVYRDPYLADARAAIEAMRATTFEMVEAGASLAIDPGTAEEVWQAIIDAALQEPTP